MKILLTGKNGQVGFELQRALAPLGEVVAVDQQDCDLADAQAIRAMVQQVQPEVIVHPAAYTAVDRAESEPDLAHAINAQAPAVLAEEASALDALLIHYSTDYVFDGSKADSYREDDQPNPLNVYGRSKWQGEQAVQRANPRHLILRTSWVIGAHGANFAKTMLRLAAERDQLRVVADQFGAPTSAALLADCTAQIIGRYRHEGAEGFPYGTYHLAPAGETNWCELARHVLGVARAAGCALKAGPEAVQPISSADYPTAAQRPLNSRLDCRLFSTTFGLHLPSWQAGIDHILQQILQQILQRG